MKIEGPAAADLEAVAYESLTHMQKSDPTLVFNKPVAPAPEPDVVPEGAPVLVSSFFLFLFIYLFTTLPLSQTYNSFFF